MDILTKKQRSYCMSQIKSSDTRIERIFRSELWKNGFRGYRIKSKITGRPDVYFPGKKIAVFIDGCFWHKCPKCYIRPKSQRNYWDSKVKYNINRANAVNKTLKKENVRVVRYWEHQIKNSLPKIISNLKSIYEKK